MHCFLTKLLLLKNILIVFLDEKKTKEKIKRLKNEMEKYYNVKFNFNEKFSLYPKFKASGKYSDLTFKNNDNN